MDAGKIVFLDSPHIRQFERWTVFSAVIGVVSGLGALFFYHLLALSGYFLLGGVGGYFPPSPGGEASLFGDVVGWTGGRERWWLLVVTTLGGLAAGIIIYTFAPEAEGHGTDAVIDAYNFRRGVIRGRVPLVKIVASALTIGSGGSAGREGPIAQIGAGFGSLLAGRLRLSERDRRMMVVCGVAGGIGSIFKAPLGGAIFAIEVLYMRDMETEGLMPAFISSTVAYAVFSSFTGWGSVFRTPDYTFSHPVELFFYGLLGLLCAVTGILYIHTFYGMRERVFRRIKIRPHYKPALGGLMLGLIAVFFPQVLSMGYGWIQSAMDGDLPLKVMLILVGAKILATSVTIGSGGSGGVFAPSLVIGAMVGGAFGSIINSIFPSIEPTAFVPVGMVALLAGVAKTPIAAIVMVSELSGNYNLLAPFMVAATISYALTGTDTIYEKQVFDRAASPAHRKELTIDILEDAKVRDAMEPDVITVTPQTGVQTILNLIHKYGHRGYPVVENRDLVGIVAFEDVEKVPASQRENTRVGDVMNHRLVVAYPDESLESALRKLLKHNIGRLPVVKRENEKRLLGILTKSDIIRLHAKLSSNR